MMSKGEIEVLKSYPHHNTLEYCENRPKYRQGRKLTAVKVYTVNDESQHLLIRGVPSINLFDEVQKLCIRYGHVSCIKQVQFEEQEQFTQCFHVIYYNIQSARFAKKQIDTKNFFGSILNVCYAPELESIQQTKIKLQVRDADVSRQLAKLGCQKNNRELTKLSNDLNISYQFQDDLIVIKNNRWVEGGLKCSYIEPKHKQSKKYKKTSNLQFNNLSNPVSFNTSICSQLIPRQISVPVTRSTAKNNNRVIFHNSK
ncbi:RNA-binding protein 48 [Daktulosphaira vitifoliae]|uniref:RNA-binding protein 48 n=1 Tax=Daktulosphaira vitifoliae TaxID=58002 RepID=UPI0021AA334D|nr:RNA-binding protein 48 [Daktulosphaira vitifoliae]XP_050521708.1 RNA-binding protein 48 [Daktulosphaira vitifoliae]XP_050521709.1 RNA-binding protein 48 [Daktulosphaira vitifoliae]